MTTVSRLTLAIAVAALLSQSGCIHRYKYTVYDPVYMSWAELRAHGTAAQVSPRALENPGKVYVFGDLIFVNERNEGIHVIDGRDPAALDLVAFIKVPGSVDIAVLEAGGTTYLYTDSFVDLLVFEIDANPDSFRAELVTRRESVFPYDPYQMLREEEDLPWYVDYDPAEGVIIGFEEREETEWSWGYLPYGDTAADVGGASEGRAGIAGSMARFVLYRNGDGDDWYLYTVDDNDLAVFGLDQPASPTRQARVAIGWGIETIYTYRDNLFIGSISAMYVFGLQNPKSPTLKSEFVHWTSYDPVVVGPVNGADTAFVTLRSDRGWGVDELLAVDVEDVLSPAELATIAMWNPHGLAFFEHEGAPRIVVTEGSGGFKVFDVAAVRDSAADVPIREVLAVDNDRDGYDVISLGDLLFVVGDDGLSAYRYEEKPNPATGDPVASVEFLGSIPVAR